MAEIDSAYLNNRVGPIFRCGEIAQAAVEAAFEDNPDKAINVDDKGAYIRIDADGELVLRRETMEHMLGRPFRMAEIEVDLSSFAGRIEMTPEFVRFYFAKTV